MHRLVTHICLPMVSEFEIACGYNWCSIREPVASQPSPIGSVQLHTVVSQGSGWHPQHIWKERSFWANSISQRSQKVNNKTGHAVPKVSGPKKEVVITNPVKGSAACFFLSTHIKTAFGPKSLWNISLKYKVILGIVFPPRSDRQG